MRLTAAIPVGALLGGLLLRWLEYRAPTVLGLSLCAVSFYLLSRWGLEVSDPAMTLHLVLGGLGFGLVIASLGTAVLNSVGDRDRGTAAALLTVMRMVGMMVGLSAMTWWGMGRFQSLAKRISNVPTETETSAEAAERVGEQLSGAVLTLFHNLFLAAMAVCIVAIVLVLGMGVGVRERECIGATLTADS